MRAAVGESRVLCGLPIVSVLLASLILLLLGSCGGGSLSLTQDSAGDWPGHTWDQAVRRGSFAAVAVDDSERNIAALTDRLALTVVPTENGQRVTICARNMPASSHAYLHLRYDPESMHPLNTYAGRPIRESVVCAGITSRRGVVAIGLASIGGAPDLSGDVQLAEVEFSNGAFSMGAGRQACAVTDATVNNLRFDSTQLDLLKWSYRSPGDYDQNMEVNIADVTPIGIYFGRTTTATDWASAQVADGDSNGEVNIADLTPIGVHFLQRVTDYRAQAGPTGTGPFGGIGDVPFSEGVVPAGGGFKQFSFIVDTPIEGAWYVVTALDGATVAAGNSNAAQYSGTAQYNPPLNLTAVSNGTNIVLSWNAPSGSLPDSYSAYIGSTAAMSDAVLLDGGISATAYEVSTTFPPTGDYYFGVKAIYGSHQSAYATTHFTPSGGTAPANLTAQRVSGTPDFIQLNWEAPGTDTPTGYNAYVATDDLMSDALKLNNSGLISGLTFDVSPLLFSPDTVHYFGVKADYGGTESDYSNIYFYDPAGGPDTDPPVWQGGTGIKSVAPDNGFVTVTWYPAIDAKSPPVTYLLAYCPDTEEPNWDTADTFDSTRLTTNISGLTNNTRYKFAVRAEDAVTPTPNRTTNENVLYATPMVFPSDGALSDIVASDVASVRMSGEEMPRIVAVNHTTEIWYCRWMGSAWDTLDLNTVLLSPDRKYHPQAVGVGSDIHIVYGTQNGVFEIFGDKDAAPATWQRKTIVGTGISGVTGIGFAYSAAGDYFAVVYATKVGTEKLFYSDRNASGEWNTPLAIMDGSPEIWQCDLAINDSNGSQWVVAANGKADSSGDDLKFWYGTRSDRLASWTIENTGYGGDVMVVEIDPTIDQPVVVDAEVRLASSGGNSAPVSDATVFTWDGGAWQKNVLEQGDFIVEMSSDFTTDTILTGQDPQLVFSQTGKAVALWSNIDVLSWLLDDTTDVTGDWRFSQRPESAWSSPTSMLPNITSSNSVTAGEGYQHCVTCNIGAVDSGDTSAIYDKYSQRNSYVEGELWYHRQTW